MATHVGWAARLLSCLLREGDGSALLGDLDEEYATRVNLVSRGDARRWYRRELYASLLAVLWLRSGEYLRAVPSGIVAAAYIGVGLYEIAAVWFLSRTWPERAQWNSALRLVIEFPGLSLSRTSQRPFGEVPRSSSPSRCSA